MSQTNVLCFCFFPAQIAAIRAAQEIGLRVVCVDHSRERESFAQKYVDEFYAVGPRPGPPDFRPYRKFIDLDEVVRIAKKNQVCAIIPTPAGNEAMEIGILNERLGLRGLNYAQSWTCVDKAEWYRFCKRRGLPYLNQATITQRDYAQKFSNLKIRFPAIIKPVSGAMSAYTRSLRDRRDLEDFFSARKGWNFGAFSEFLVQEHHPGQQLLVEFTVTNRQIHDVFYRDALYDDFPQDLCHGSVGPSKASQRVLRNVYDFIDIMVRELEVNYGSFACDFIIGGDGTPYCIDPNPRPSGAGQEMIRQALGYNYAQEILRSRIGEDFNFTPRVERYSAYLLWRPRPGTIKSVDYPPLPDDMVFENSDLRGVRTGPGTTVIGPRNISNNRERYYTHADSYDGAKAKLEEYFRRIRVEYEG